MMNKIKLGALFSFFVLIANTTVFSGYMAYYYLTIKAEMTDELEKSANSVSEWLSGALRTPLWTMDKKTTEDIIVSGMNRQVFAVIVTDEFGKIFFGIKRNENWEVAPCDDAELKGNFFTSVSNINDNGYRLGKVEAYLSPKFMKSRLARSISSMIAVLCILNIIIVLLLSFFVQHVIIRPITATVNRISRLSGGDIPETVTKRYIGEFNKISESLNRLIDTTRETTRISNDIAAGNISIDVVERSENDQLMSALKVMIQTLNGIMNETNGMIRKVGEGEHCVHGDAEAFHGVWRDLVAGVNHLMDMRMRAVEALRESEERLQMVLDGSNLGFWDWRVQTGEVYRNEQWANMIGYTLHDIQLNVKQWIDLIHPDDRATASESIRNHLEGRSPMHKAEYRMLCKDGRWKWILDQARIVKRDDDGRPFRMSGTHTDITERKHAEEALRDEKERLMVTLRSIGDGVITTDGRSRIVLVNKVAEDLTGWRWDEAEGKHISEVFHIIDEHTRRACDNPIEEVIETGAVSRAPNNRILVTRSGSERIVADNGAPIRNRNGEVIGAVLVFRDITQQILIENELRQAQKLESIGVLAGGVAHDFNNLLGVISGNVSYVLSQIDQAGELFEALKDVQTGTSQAQKLTQQLLTFAKGGAPIKKEADLRDILKESALFVARGSKTRCEFQFSDHLWTASVDTGQINQAVGNIVINALQATPEGGVVRIKAENHSFSPNDKMLLPPGDYVKITIEDNGPGIPEKQISQIFDPYFTTKQKGTGLGLSTTYSIIKRHNGQITVDSQLEKGTIFNIYLPAEKKRPPVGDKHEKQVDHKGYGKILLMDDEEMIRDMAGRVLNVLGYDTETAENGEQAVDMYRKAFNSQQPFDLVVLDLTVPGGMGGAETIKELLQIDPHVKAVVSSGYSNDPVMANYEDYGFCGVISKPYTKAEASETLRKIFSG